MPFCIRKLSRVLALIISFTFIAGCGSKRPEIQAVPMPTEASGAGKPGSDGANNGNDANNVNDIDDTNDANNTNNASNADNGDDINDADGANSGDSSQADGANAEFTVGKTVVHVFGEGEKAQLYCGFEALNTGDCPAILNEVLARFDVTGGKRYETDFAPVAAGYDVVPPGGMTFCALWMPAREALPEEPQIKLSLTLSASEADANANALDLAVKNARVIQNYPEFATLSGSLWNESGEECPLNVVYAAFYDAAGELLGVYHFTKNASINADEFKNFVVHMRPLPIAGLAEDTAAIQTRAFGIE